MAMLTKDSKSPKRESPDSLPVPPEAYEREEYFCKFVPRIHRYAHLADAGGWQCQLDLLGSQGNAYIEAVRSGTIKSYAIGCINPTVGSFVALCATEAIPERLGLMSYILEYGFVHDDLIEYAEEKNMSELSKANTDHVNGFVDYGDGKLSARNNAKRQIQAKMATELLEIDRDRGLEILRLWKEMSDIFVDIRDLEFQGLEEYFPFRAVDAGCPWTMALLNFSMDFYLTPEETEQTSAITKAGYDAWLLVNDYFSWEKELKNYEAKGSTGKIVNAVFLFMKWHSVDGPTAKKMLRREIMAREERYCQLKAAHLASGNVTERIIKWLGILDTVTAGNFAWSMTTPRYHEDAGDAYPGLLAASQTQESSIDLPIVPLAITSTEESIEEHETPETLASPRSSAGDEPSTAPTSLDLSEQEYKAGPPISDYEEIMMEPYVYLKSLPSKGVRNAAIDGLDVWYQAPERSVAIIQEITDLSHCSSLMISDIEDNSPLRHGSPATHIVFGINQTINTANHLLIKAFQAALTLSPTAANILAAGQSKLHTGRGMDLHWTLQTKIPTEKEYFTMIDGKTGGLFVLIAELMRSEATANKDLDVSLLMKSVGRLFQAHGDYSNLHNAYHATKKGVAEDFGESRISLPLIHALRAKSPQRGRLLNILQKSKVGGSQPPGMQKLALDDIVAAGGLDYTKEVAMRLQRKVTEDLAFLEGRVGAKNWILRLMKKRLEI